MPGGASPALVERFELAYADEHGEQRIPLTEAWSVPFEACTPVRGFPSYKGQRHHDPEVVGIASQPFWLFWTTDEGKARSHAPDYFARLADDTALVLDVPRGGPDQAA